MQFSSAFTHWTTIAAAILAFAPVVAFGVCSTALPQRIRTSPHAIQITLAAALAIPYLLTAIPSGWLRWQWLALYLLLPSMVAALLILAAKLDPDQRGHWLDFVVLLSIGLAVDLRWFEPAWPRGLAFMNKLLLLDAG